MEWIDIGANLTHDSFDQDRHQVLARARSVGVVQIVVTGASVAGSHAALALANAGVSTSADVELFATAGVHPHHAVDLAASDLPQLRTLLQQGRVVAVGECGLDYFRNFSPRVDQLRALEWQLQLAAECGKPVFLHQRDAHADFMGVLRNHRAHLSRAVVHCFTGTGPELEQYLELGCFIGITGWICDERRGRHLLELVPRIPDAALLLETDAPYLLPRDLPRVAANAGNNGRRNEPMHLPHVGTAVAAARGQSTEDVAALTTANARVFFGLVRPSVSDLDSSRQRDRK